MFTYGFDKRGSEHAGLLAKGSLGSVKRALVVAQDTLKFAEKVSIYTDGNPSLAQEIRAELAVSDMVSSTESTTVQSHGSGMAA